MHSLWRGGYLLIAPHTDEDAAIIFAERIRQAVETAQIRLADGGSIPITVSIGVALLLGTDQPDALIGRADRALYEAKHHGRNRVVCRQQTSSISAV